MSKKPSKARLRTVLTRTLHCPGCERDLPAHDGVTDSTATPFDKNAAPISLCAHCDTVSEWVFADDGTISLRKVHAFEIALWPEDLKKDLETARRMGRDLRKQHGE